MPKKPEAVITDFAGVYAEDGLQTFLKKLSKEQEIPIDELQKVNRKYLFPFHRDEIDEDDYWNGLFDEAGIVGNISEAKEELRAAHKPYQTVIDFFDALKEKTKTGLLTNCGKEWFEYHNQRFGLSETFDAAVASYMLGVRKPDVGIYHYILAKLGVNAEDAVYLDDRKKNLEPFKDLGGSVIHVESPGQAVAALRAIGL
jgi:epoxide hydrolase-like predicted phosphatase